MVAAGVGAAGPSPSVAVPSKMEDKRQGRSAVWVDRNELFGVDVVRVRA